MKSLYININNEDIQSNDELEVVLHDLDADFFYHLGCKIAKDCKVKNENALITDFNTQEHTKDYQKIIAQWNELKTILFGEECEGEFEFILPDTYIRWLRYSEKYNSIFEENFSHSKSAVISIDLEELYEESVEALQHKILRRLKKNDLYLDIDEIVFNNDLVTRKSPIVCAIKKMYDGISFVHLKKWNYHGNQNIKICSTQRQDDMQIKKDDFICHNTHSNSCVNRFSPPLIDLFNQDFDNFAINSEHIVRDVDSYYYAFIDNSNKAYHNVCIGSYGSPSKIINSITFLDMSQHQWILDFGITENLSFNNIQAVLRTNGFKIIHAKYYPNDVPRNLLVAESADCEYLVIIDQMLDGYWQDSLTILLNSCPICGCNKINVVIDDSVNASVKLGCNKCGDKWHTI